jgi:hypothetical protein
LSALKIESARRQLGTALALYLQDLGPVSVHCLAGGGCELIEFYAKKAGAEPFSSHILKARPDVDIKKLRRLQRQYWNAFKHAQHGFSGQERDDDELLSRFRDEQNDVVLFIGWHDYALATKTMPVEAQVQQAWYMALHPEKLDLRYPAKPYQQLFPDLRDKPRTDQKRMLNEAIARARLDTAVMNDARTDTRQLILGWNPERPSR